MSATELERGTIEVEEVLEEDEDIEDGCAHIYPFQDCMTDDDGVTIMVPRKIALCGMDDFADEHSRSCKGGLYNRKRPNCCPGCGAPVCAYCRLLDT